MRAQRGGRQTHQCDYIKLQELCIALTVSIISGRNKWRLYYHVNAKTLCIKILLGFGATPQSVSPKGKNRHRPGLAVTQLL